ncbi:MAG TPA: hypothetical protein VK829_09770 [Terriglobales bacterium]|jgi:hypothetical protein|nr:hypothetical protein [Terriglobales bacterium]
MTDTGMSPAAMVRATDAMLQALGGDQVSMIFPLITMPNDPSAQLGLADPGVEEVIFYPVVVRSLVTPATGPRRRLEFMLSGATVAAEVISRNVASAEILFDGALGLLYDGDLFHIENVTTEYFAGTAYLYRVLAVE